jgi:signal transduction histidine kinase
MAGNPLIGRFDKRRLQTLLAFFFMALAVPTGVLIWQAYSQLKWEAFHQYRGMAEELTRRIDASVTAAIDGAEGRSFADYTFLVVSGDPSANFVQRSPLSELPVIQDLPGVIGYFQVGTDGEFSTPLLPQGHSVPASFGIGQEEYRQRLQLAQQIQEVLSDNRLVRHESKELRSGFATTPQTPESGLGETEVDANVDRLGARQRQIAEATAELSGESLSDKDEVLRSYNVRTAAAAKPNEGYSQSVFDELNSPRKSSDDQYTAGGLAGEARDGVQESKERQDSLGKVADLKLDAAYQKKSEVVELSQKEEQIKDAQRLNATGRMKRREQIALPEERPAAATAPARQAAANLASLRDLRISTFESEIDPLEFSLLDSGHFVLFRKVWRDGERYIQGLLIDKQAFIRDAFDYRFSNSALSAVGNLIVAFQDDVIHTLAGSRYGDYPGGSREFDGALLYRSRLAAPLSGLELIYSINGLPPGPGAAVLGWVTLVLGIVFLGGFYTLYRLGIGQINLARQQQDFVSAVSHELKTPLTSIRMYGEMLKEGWADPEKQQQYYEFIHDESERLSRLISNVLQLARITRNEPQFDLKPVTLGELMSQIESKIANQVQRAGFELRFHRDEESGQAIINIDEDCFAQIVINLVDNAIKFSRAADEKLIEITGKLTAENRVLFAVRDFGPGVPKNQMKKIFKLFYRSESELTRETVGTGIGLAIVHQLSQAMDGKADMINTEPGAEFRVSFPIAKA